MRSRSISWMIIACLCGLATACGRGDDTSRDMSSGEPPAMEMGARDMTPEMPAPSEDAGPDEGADLDPSDLEDMTLDQGPELVEAYTLDSGPWALTVDPAGPELRWGLAEGDEAPLLVFPLDGLQLGVVDRVSSRSSYDPVPLKDDQLVGREPPLDAWLGLERVRAITPDGGSGAQVELEFDGGVRARLRVEVLADGRVELDWQPLDAEGDGVVLYRLRPQVDAQEGFYGLGEWFDAPEHRGRVRAMHLVPDPEIESGYNEAHVPVPLLIGTRGWGLFVASDWPGVFEVAAERDDRVDAIFGAGQLAGQGLTFHLFAAEHPLDITHHYYQITGAPRLPARWTLGTLVWRDENEDQAQVVSDAETMRQLDLPASGYWIDRPYATAVNTFDFNAGQFTDPAAMIQRQHELGLRVGLWHVPYLDEDRAATGALRQEATEMGYYPPRSGLLLNQWGEMIDLTNPQARGWWQEQLSYYIDLGVEGFKLDYGEDIVPGALGNRIPWEFADGSDERTMHARFQQIYHSTYAELLPSQEGYFLLCRGGTWGDQVNAPIIWPGDLDANLLEHRELGVTRDGESYVAVGGLPAALIAGSSLGPSGFAFYGSDTGGYRHSPPDKETFTRWFEQTALSTVMQIGTSTNDVAWEPTPDNGFDAEMLEWYRRYTRLHTRLFPYLWTYAERLDEDGRAIQRPLGLAHPELGEHPKYTYMLGDHLLVAPVVRRGQRQREVILPQGDWIDWWTGEVLEGGRTIMVEAPLETLPLYLRAGGIVPLLRPTIDSLSPTTEPDLVDSYATTPGRLYPVVGVGFDGEFVLFDGARVTVQEQASRVVVITGDGDEFDRGVQLELVGLGQAPAAVTMDGAALPEAQDLEALEALESGWAWVGEGRRGLHVRGPSGEHTFEVQK